MKVVVDSLFLERIVGRMVAEEETPPCMRKGIDRFSCFYEYDEDDEDDSCNCNYNCVNGVILDNYYCTYTEKEKGERKKRKK